MLCLFSLRNSLLLSFRRKKKNEKAREKQRFVYVVKKWKIEANSKIDDGKQLWEVIKMKWKEKRWFFLSLFHSYFM
jgi:hypothetical protein